MCREWDPHTHHHRLSQVYGTVTASTHCRWIDGSNGTTDSYCGPDSQGACVYYRHFVANEYSTQSPNRAFGLLECLSGWKPVVGLGVGCEHSGCILPEHLLK